MEVRPVKPWVFWVMLNLALYVALATSFICAVLAVYARQSVEDRAHLNRRQDQIQGALNRLEATEQRLDERSDYLDKTVRGLIQADRARQERRKAEAKK